MPPQNRFYSLPGAGSQGPRLRRGAARRAIRISGPFLRRARRPAMVRPPSNSAALIQQGPSPDAARIGPNTISIYLIDTKRFFAILIVPHRSWRGPGFFSSGRAQLPRAGALEFFSAPAFVPRDTRAPCARLFCRWRAEGPATKNLTPPA